MNYSQVDIVFQEVPNEVSLCFYISGCDIKCKGCHSPEVIDENYGEELNEKIIDEHIKKNRRFITTILFMGMGLNQEEFINILHHISFFYPELKIALYTGYEKVSERIIKYLTYIKTGPYIEKLGGLNSPLTNQRIYNTKTKENLNKYFITKK